MLNKASQKIENLKGVLLKLPKMLLKLPKSVLVQSSMSYRTRNACRIFSCFRRFGQLLSVINANSKSKKNQSIKGNDVSCRAGTHFDRTAT